MLQKVSGRMQPQTYTDVFMYLTGRNRLWDDKGIARTENSLKTFGDILQNKNLIIERTYALGHDKWYQNPYMSERMSGDLDGVEQILKRITKR
jgi:hypothetical protein